MTRLPGSAAQAGGSLSRGSGETPNTLAMLGALCFFLSALEYLIPKPLPFMRIGLANMPLLLALNVLGVRDFFVLVVLKIAGQGLIGGTFLSFVFLFSIVGTFASAAVMYALGALPGKLRFGFVGISCAGAMVSNTAQLLVARHLLFGAAARYLAPPFLAAGFVAGVALGIICEYFCRSSQWRRMRARGGEADGLSAADAVAAQSELVARDEARGLRRESRLSGLFRADELFVAGLLMALVFLHDRSMPGHFMQLLFFCALAWFFGKKNNPLVTAVFMAGIVFFNLLAPHGRVLFSLGPLSVTQGSLLVGLERAVTLTGLLMLSRACVRSDLRLPGAAGSLLAETLRLLELMRGRKPAFARGLRFWRAEDRGHAIAEIDRMMLELEAEPRDGNAGAVREKPRRSAKGVLLLALMIALTAAIGFAPQVFARLFA